MLKEIQARFADPPCEYRGAPFWSWNDRMEPDEVRRQIREFHAAGIGGFFMHSRGGLETPFLSEQWFRACDAAIDEARKLGMLAWAYDEDRWPSGAAGGIVTGRFPETAAKFLEAVREDAFPAVKAGVVAVFRPARKGWMPTSRPAGLAESQQYLVFYQHAARSQDWYNGRPALDVLDPEAVARFIEVGYQPYADRYPKDLGKTLPGVFTDEPNFFSFGQGQADSGIVMPWTPKLLAQFRKRRGYDLAEYLPALIGEKTSGKAPDEVRHDYWMTITELFVENFSQQIGQWCSKHKVALTGHWLFEESLMGQAHVAGATMPHYVHEAVPGIDILCRRTTELLTVKQTASVAHQWGRKRLISELYGASGWDLSLQDQKWIGDWQYALGVNYRCQHLSLYSLRGERKRDYPPSHMPHQPWWPQYKLVEDYFARLSLALSVGQPIREVAVIHPIRSAWANLALPYDGKKGNEWQVEVHLQQMLNKLLYSQIDLDFVDEMLLHEYGGARKNTLFVNKVAYRIVVIPEMTHVAPSTAKILLKIAKAGARLFYTGSQPIKVYDSKVPAQMLKDLTKQVNKLLAGVKVNLDDLPDLLRAEMAEPVKVAPASRMLYQLRADGDERLLFLTNQQDGPAEVTVEVAGGSDLQLWCTETGRACAWPYEVTATGVRFRVWLSQAGSVVLTYKAQVPKASLPGQVSPPVQTVPVALPERLAYRLDKPNVLYLDRASLSVEGTGVRLEGFVPQIGRQARAIVGLPDTRYSAKQPWAWGRHRSTGKQVVLTYAFDVDQVPPEPVSLGVEQPQRKMISLNGEPVSNQPQGHYLDPSIPVVNLPNLRPGRNTIEIREDLDTNFDAEAVYLLGSFGVWDRKIGPLPEAIQSCDWTNQGLPFYAGSVTCLVPVYVNDAGTYEVEVAAQGAVTVGVGIDGQAMTHRAFAPWRFVVPFQSGQNMVAVQMTNSLRNLMGPHHFRSDRPMWVGPGELAPDESVDRYVHVPSGLLELRIARIQ